jgi:DNA polymerase-3 subunit gamma/tau
MLGLADRGRIFDLIEHVFRGDAKAALASLDALHRDGAEPVLVLADLAEAVHAAARFKTVGAEAGSEGLSAEEKRRAGAIADRLSTPLLSRAWQMLLKGGEEAAKAGNPRAAAEMVLIRLAYTADLPSPDEVIRLLGGEGALARSGKPAAEAPATREPVARAPAAPSAPLPPIDDEDPGFDSEWDAAEGDILPDGDEAAPGGRSDPRSFDDVIALTGERRDMRLKLHLEDHVSLVKYDPAAGSIDVFLLPGAPPQIANELREKLNAWTGRRWMVVVSKEAGERPRGEVRREREAAELESIKSHPAVKAVLDQFPDAKIAEVRPLIGPAKDETGTG